MNHVDPEPVLYLNTGKHFQSTRKLYLRVPVPSVADPNDFCTDPDPTKRSGSGFLIKNLFILNSEFFLLS